MEQCMGAVCCSLRFGRRMMNGTGQPTIDIT
jgi:hypothetical protein